MEDLLRISSDEYANERYRYRGLDTQFAIELTQRVQDAGGTVYHEIVNPRAAYENLPPSFPKLQHGAISPEQVIVALGSAGVFSALYQSMASYFARNQNRELTLEKGKVKITIKGHRLPEETELLKQLAPELLPQDKPKSRDKQ